ncbi:PRC-barrel domain-containing protein [Pseudorhodobacter ferrugineus]|uniref:PRC-barrel domain-containing protein n=1 Tax=Pseudorhodobacter ferrugineus TaxID=77008 RepID=UPI0003B360B3|nr:PRC-barrel domain-containing protein [Pseudorhodobacter ferrugineus]
MHKILLSTAVAAVFAVPALAQDSMFRSEPTEGAVHASDLIGARVYASEGAVDANSYNGIQQGWEDIGEINDVVVSKDGRVESVLVDIGGFLGMGERQTAVDMTALRFVYDDATADNPEDWFVVMNANRAMIETAPEWTRTAMYGTGMATTTAPMAADGTPASNAERDGYVLVPAAEITSEALTGANVYDSTDKDIGEVSNLILSTDGKIDGVIVDVGGFLGMGEKPVMVKMSELNVLRNADGSDLRVYVTATKEALEAMPTYSN